MQTQMYAASGNHSLLGCASGPAERVANRDTVCGHPVIAKLKEIPNVVNVHLRPDKHSAFDIEAYTSS